MFRAKFDAADSARQGSITTRKPDKNGTFRLNHAPVGKNPLQKYIMALQLVTGKPKDQAWGQPVSSGLLRLGTEGSSGPEPRAGQPEPAGALPANRSAKWRILPQGSCLHQKQTRGGTGSHCTAAETERPHLISSRTAQCFSRPSAQLGPISSIQLVSNCTELL